MNKPVYLGLSVLDLSKIAMYNFWGDYIKPKCGKKAKLCYMDTGSYIVHIKTEGCRRSWNKIWHLKLSNR